MIESRKISNKNKEGLDFKTHYVSLFLKRRNEIKDFEFEDLFKKGNCMLIDK